VRPRSKNQTFLYGQKPLRKLFAGQTLSGDSTVDVNTAQCHPVTYNMTDSRTRWESSIAIIDSKAASADIALSMATRNSLGAIALFAMWFLEAKKTTACFHDVLCPSATANGGSDAG
jgi:hypothetical protein